MNIRIGRRVAAMLALRAIEFALAGAAGAAGAAGVAETADSPALDEILVTAQRRPEPAQSIGIAMAVIPGADLAARHIEKINDLQNATPSFEAEPAFGGGQTQFRLRGVGFIDYASNNSSPVGISIDEVPLSVPIQSRGQLFDIDRIEVLRGPQGTLYGRNTTGGVVNVITQRPTADAHAGVSLDYGSHDAFSGEGYLSGTPLPGLPARIAVATERGGAWQRNRVTGANLGDKDRWAERAQFEWNATKVINFRLGLHASKDRSDALGLYLFSDFDRGMRGPSVPADTDRYLTGWGLRPQFAQLAGIPAGSKPGVDNSNDGADLTAHAELGTAELTSITAYDHLVRREYDDWDASSYAESDVFFRSGLTSFSQELRARSTRQGPFDWLGGAFYSKEKLAEQFYTDFTDSLGGIATTRYRQDSQSLGLFGQGDYRLAKALKGTLGLRLEHETRDLIDLNTSFGALPSIIGGGAQSRSLAASDWSGKAGAEYDLAPGSLLYGSVSRGVKSGGFTAHHTTQAAAVDAFKPEKLIAYEIGLKSRPSPLLQINGAVFYYDYRDQQILSKDLDPANGSLIGRFVNAPKSVIAGAEIELHWQPTQAFELSHYAGYKEGKYKSTIFNAPALGGPPVDFKGQDLSFPKLSYGGETAYRLNFGGFQLEAETNWSYHDSYAQLFLLDSSVYTVKAYWLANAQIELSPLPSKSWRVSVWGRNIFNRNYDLTRNFFLAFASAAAPGNPIGGTNVAAPGEPATVGIRASWSY